jgi:hypothetical protein
LLAYASRKYAMNMADRELLLWCRAVIYLSGTILSSTMLARLLIGSPETVLSALIECYE